jgi:alanine-synthesizing transaminase
MFSSRLPPDAVPNALARRLETLRAANLKIIDLTESNPTRAGFAYSPAILADLAAPEALRYAPSPLGVKSAREAVAADYVRRGALVNPDDVVLTSSTSEAYSWLFKLLCNPGEGVLVPRPSYPLFEHLTRLDSVTTQTYDLDYHGRWEIDFPSLEGAVDRGTRAILVVSPNNPTGSYVSRTEAGRLLEVCETHGVALIVDEVFVDYSLDAPHDRATDIAVQDRVLAFSLGGLSKSAGLPQLKLGWIVVGGPAESRRAALGALELIADSYLSVSTPVQVAAPALIAGAHEIRGQIHDRVRTNLAQLRQVAAQYPACRVLPVEGGWYAVVRVPAVRGEDTLILDLLDRERILVHPGYFFDFPREAYVVVSLLPDADAFADATARMLHLAVS